MKKLMIILSALLFANQTSAGSFDIGDVFVCEPSFDLRSWDNCKYQRTSEPAPCWEKDITVEVMLDLIEPVEAFVFKIIEAEFLGKPSLMIEFNDTKHFGEKRMVVRSISSDGEYRWIKGNAGAVSNEIFYMEDDFIFKYSDVGREMKMLRAICEKF